MQSTIESEQSIDRIIRTTEALPTQKVRVAVTDIDGILRGKFMHMDKFSSLKNEGFGFCDVVFGWDAHDEVYEKGTQTGWHTGFPDATVKLDYNTFRQIPWEHNIPFFLGDFYDDVDQPLGICPRNLLKKIRDKALSLGYSPLFAQEFEWYNFREDSATLHQNQFQNLTPITQGMFGYSVLRASQNSDFFNALFDQLGQFKVPIEGLHTESGPGVYEAAIQYSELLEAADRAVLFKTAVKEIGARHGISPTFMAKWHPKLPGCSGHLHQSLWDSELKQNLFAESEELMHQYIAGQLHCMTHLLPMYAPTVNSYKRFVPGYWAPTHANWGVDNRTVALRVIPGSNKSKRIELRIPGSDVNPYLAMAASLASGLYGIQNKLSLPESPEPLAKNLQQATEKMKHSEIAAELLGETFVEHFTMTREWEWRQYEEAITDWEFKRYFEVI